MASRNRRAPWILRGLMIMAAAAATGCNPSGAPAAPGWPGGPGGAGMPVPVRLAKVERATLPRQYSTIGTVEARTTVQVKAQAGGELIGADFKEGDQVTKGQVLFRIDPRPYEAALGQAEANLSKTEAMAAQARAALSRDNAQAKNSQTEADRTAALFEKKMVSQEENDRYRTAAEAQRETAAASAAAVKSADEAVRAAAAAVEDARLKLGYCTITAPVTGRTGSLLAHPGNLVKANDTAPLVVINEIQPALVSFTLPERNLADVRRRMAEGALGVRAAPPGREDSPSGGVLEFVDNQVDQAAGTIRMKALFPNTDEALWPGQFVRVVMDAEVLADAVAAPDAAVKAGQNGFYLYVVDADMKVERRPVKTGGSVNGMTVITEGAEPGETVIVDGHLRVAPGAVVRPAGDGPAAGAAPEGPKAP